MRFLADESCDFSIVRALRSAEHDVAAVCELKSGAADIDVLQLSVRDRRILLTEDRDFGRWVYADREATAGVVLARYRTSVRRQMPAWVVAAVEQYGDALTGAFTVIEPGRVRVAKAP